MVLVNPSAALGMQARTARLQSVFKVGFLVLGVLCSLRAFGWLPFLPRPVLGVPLILFCAWPWLMLWSPNEASPLKLGLLSVVFSPALVSVFDWLLRWQFSPAAAEATLAILLTFGAALSLRKKWRQEALGRAAWLCLALGGLLAGSLGWLLLGQGEPSFLRQNGVLWHAGLAQTLQRGVLPENPWLAGTAPATQWCFDVLLASIAKQLQLPPASAMAGLSVLAAAVLCTAAYLCAAPLWRDSKACLLAPTLMVLAPQAWRNFGYALRPPGQTNLAVDAAPESGLSPWLEVGPLPWVYALVMTMWFCAAHALRHGARPWSGLCAAALFLVFALAPWLGLLVFVPLLSTALLCPGQTGVRERVLPALALAILAGSAIAIALGWRTETHWRSSEVYDWSYALELVGPPALIALPQLLTRRRPVGADEQGRRTIVVLLWTTVACGICMPWVSAFAARQQIECVRIAALAAALLAAGSLAGGWHARGWRRLLALCLSLSFLGGGAWRATQTIRAWRSQPTLGLDLEWTHPVPSAGAGNDFVRAMGWLRERYEQTGETSVLFCTLDQPAERLNRPSLPHLAPILSGMSMWCDRDADLSQRNPRWRERRAGLQRLYAEALTGLPETDWDPTIFQPLRESGRSAYVLVREVDRRESRGQVEGRLALLGAKEVQRQGEFTIWHWSAGERP